MTPGTGRRAISVKMPSTQFRLVGELVPAFDEEERERGEARRLRPTPDRTFGDVVGVGRVILLSNCVWRTAA
jgi:hypothetical protein